MTSLNKSHNHILLSIKNHKRTININRIIYLDTKYPIVKEIALKMDFQITQDIYNLIWTDHALTIKQIKEEPVNTKINHIPEITQITRKNKMANNLNAMKNYFPKEYNFYPQTYILPSDLQKLMKKHHKGKIYICKPDNGCQGQGIYLIDHPNQLQKCSTEVIQQYIMNPCLIDELKFDLRVYVLITCINPLRVYLYNDGIARFATEKFQKPNHENMDNFYSHLTNYAINKDNCNFKVDDLNHNQGHKRLITSVFKNQEYTSLMNKIGKIVIKTIVSGLPCMQNAYGQCKKNDPNTCFQLLGFDIILTDKKQPLLLQVNQNPSLVTDTLLDYNLKFGLVKTIFEMMTGNYNIFQDQKFENKIKMKDRHENSFKGNFNKIYPCFNLQQTEDYDEFIVRANTIYKDKFGLNPIRSSKKMEQTKASQEWTSWNQQPHHYTKQKVQKVYKARIVKTSNFKKRLIFI